MGTAGVGLLAHEAVLVAIALALALRGLGAGASLTMGPAVASDAMHPQERGGRCDRCLRAAALFVASLGAAAVMTVAPVAIALTLGGALFAALFAAPTVFTRSLARIIRERALGRGCDLKSAPP